MDYKGTEIKTRIANLKTDKSVVWLMETIRKTSIEEFGKNLTEIEMQKMLSDESGIIYFLSLFRLAIRTVNNGEHFNLRKSIEMFCENDIKDFDFKNDLELLLQIGEQLLINFFTINALNTKA